MDAYFTARPQILRTHALESVFRAGFERAFSMMWVASRAVEEVTAPETAGSEKPVEVWRGARKVSIYSDEVMRSPGDNVNAITWEPRTLESVQKALDWLYSPVETPAEHPDTKRLREAVKDMSRVISSYHKPDCVCVYCEGSAWPVTAEKASEPRELTASEAASFSKTLARSPRVLEKAGARPTPQQLGERHADTLRALAEDVCKCRGKLGWTRDESGKAICTDCRLPITHPEKAKPAHTCKHGNDWLACKLCDGEAVKTTAAINRGLCATHSWGAPPGQDDLECPYCNGTLRTKS
jgi:hypothetical protein